MGMRVLVVVVCDLCGADDKRAIIGTKAEYQHDAMWSLPNGWVKTNSRTREAAVMVCPSCIAHITNHGTVPIYDVLIDGVPIRDVEWSEGPPL